MIINSEHRLKYARKSLLGVSIGDAFGDSFFGNEIQVIENINSHQIPETSWEFTDDTVMSIAITETLSKFNSIDQNYLANLFASNYAKDENRGYGPSIHRKMKAISEGKNWRDLSSNAFGGIGSMGNGGAMRAAPIGAYFFDDFDKVKVEATKSSEITHSHVDGVAGSIAVAIATAITTKNQHFGKKYNSQDFLSEIIEYLPDTDTRSKINKAISVPNTYRIETVTSILGNGSNMTAQDTVPFSLWCAAHNLENFENSIWDTVAGLGDRDTTCAIVGGIVIMSCNEVSIPKIWIESVEKWESSKFVDNVG